MWGVSYWVFPLISAFCWLGMLMGMLIHWQVNNNGAHLPPMAATQTIAYISDIGSQELKPLFIAGSCVTTVFLDLSFLSERFLRHKGRLARNTSMFQKVLSWVSIGFAAVGTVGLILLSIFDNWRHNTLHNIFLVLFIGGYVISAIFICWEYQRLGIHFRQHAILRISFWIKLFFILIEIALAIGFGVCSRTGRYNAAAVLEWIIAFVFTFYVFSFFIDLIPAVRTKDPATRFSKDGERVGGFGTGPGETMMQMEQNDGAANSQTTVGQNDERVVNDVK
ncbi:Frag1/DRAM/Sfk1 family-domain-containing protein [Amylocarpus encephaloides]|uniref:Frag1/DRAM/Sfk1 family-domain-containing protein n=1 Tax=Amylocarpus encephaloides TaxID=45428 RepID=A0A9P8C5F6_9HELO|nr:Frag1/DRAM/Sfk1 family-domain-containing protein [Amylocarpus encephaloides]